MEVEEHVAFQVQLILVEALVVLEMVDLVLLFFQYQQNFILPQQQEVPQLQLQEPEQF